MPPELHRISTCRPKLLDQASTIPFASSRHGFQRPVAVRRAVTLGGQGRRLHDEPPTTRSSRVTTTCRAAASASADSARNPGSLPMPPRQLILEDVRQHLRRHRQRHAIQRHRRLAQRRLQSQAGTSVVMRIVGHHCGLCTPVDQPLLIPNDHHRAGSSIHHRTLIHACRTHSCQSVRDTASPAGRRLPEDRGNASDAVPRYTAES